MKPDLFLTWLCFSNSWKFDESFKLFINAEIHLSCNWHFDRAIKFWNISFKKSISIIAKLFLNQVSKKIKPVWINPNEKPMFSTHSIFRFWNRSLSTLLGQFLCLTTKGKTYKKFIWTLPMPSIVKLKYLKEEIYVQF